MSLESKLEELNINFGRLLDILAERQRTEPSGTTYVKARYAGTSAGLLETDPHSVAKPQADIGISTEAKALENATLEKLQNSITEKDETPAPTYDEVKKYILQISAKSRDKAVALLARYGAKGGPSLKPEQYSSFVKDALATLAGVYDPEKGE